MTPLEAALEYVELGYSVLPLHSIGPDGRCTCGDAGCASPGKHPRTARGVKDASGDLVTTRERWHLHPDSNIGIAIPRGCLVVDIDTDKGGLESVAGRHLPEEAPACRTGGGGWHYWFRLPDGFEARNTVGVLPGVDIRVSGGYVVCPPSRHNSGRVYEWQQPLVPPSELPPAPQWLLELLQPHTPARRDGHREPAVRLDPEARARIRDAALERWREGDRHNLALHLAGALYKRGVLLQEAEAIIREAAATATDEELEDRLRAVADTYAKDPSEVAGCSRLPKGLREALDAAPGLGGLSAVEPERALRHLLHLRDLFRDKFRWVHEWKTWVHWNGAVWTRTPSEVVEANALDVLQCFYAEMVQRSGSRADAERWTKRLMDVFSAHSVVTAVQLLRGCEGFLTPAASFDAGPYVMNVRNGLLCLKTLKLREHDPSALCTRMANARYDPAARAPRWEQFLTEIFAGDVELIGFVQRAVAAAMIGENRHHLLYVLFGTGCNGKSSLLTVLGYVLGSYAGPIPRDALAGRRERQDAQRTAYAALEGVRFATLEELPDDFRLSCVGLKDLTSNNPMSIRGLYENYRQVQLTMTPFVATNVKPTIDEHTEAVWRRLRLIPFVVTIPAERRDPDLPNKLKAEADGILAWLVRGLEDYWETGLREPEAVLAATTEFRTEQTSLRRS